MTVQELKAFLKDHLVPEKLYKIGGKHNKRICLQKVDNGWDLFFSEKKERIGLMHFTEETAACIRMKDELRKLMELMYGITWVGER